MSAKDMRGDWVSGGRCSQSRKPAAPDARSSHPRAVQTGDWRFYLSLNQVYSQEAGCFSIDGQPVEDGAYGLVCHMAEVLTGACRKLGACAPPDGFEPQLLVTCDAFETHRTADGEGIVVDAWRGEVSRVLGQEDGSPELALLGSYSGARELAELIEDNASDFAP